MASVPIERLTLTITAAVDGPLERIRESITRVRRDLEVFIEALEAGDVRTPRAGFGWNTDGRLGWSIHDRTTAIDVAALDDRFLVTVDLPDDVVDISVYVSASSVRVRGRRLGETDDSVIRGVISPERRYDRWIDLPEPVVVERADATVDTGVLSITLEKRKPPTEHHRDLE